MVNNYHQPVLLKGVIDALKIEKKSWYLDATLGDGGHSLEILRKGGRVIGLDVDPEALDRAKKRFDKEGIDQSKFILIRGNFRELKKLIKTETKDLEIKGVVFDLGVSSLQLDTPQRGFSFSRSGPLDMRMDPDLEVKALDLIKGLNKGELYELFYKLGEEKFAKRISDAIISARQMIQTTDQLAQVLKRAIGAKRGNHSIYRQEIHPATRVFQALRIAVNDELNAIREGLPQALEILNGGGRIGVISFHSLEDRIVKNIFKEWEDQGFGKIMTKKPIGPGVDEVRANSRSRSAKLRFFEKLS